MLGLGRVFFKSNPGYYCHFRIKTIFVPIW